MWVIVAKSLEQISSFLSSGGSGGKIKAKGRVRSFPSSEYISLLHNNEHCFRCYITMRGYILFKKNVRIIL